MNDNGQPPGAAKAAIPPGLTGTDVRVQLFLDALVHAADLAQAFGIAPEQPQVVSNQAVTITVVSSRHVLPVGGLVLPPGVGA